MRAVVEGTDAIVFMDEDYAEFCKKAECHCPGGTAWHQHGGGSALLHPLRKDDDQCPGEESCLSAELSGSDGAGFLQQAGIEVVRRKVFCG